MRRLQLSSKVLCIIQSGLFAFSTALSPALALSGNAARNGALAVGAVLSYSDLQNLSDCETTLFGGPHKNYPSDERVSSLENSVFGEAKKGDLSGRINALKLALSAGKSNNLLKPPLVPQMDNSNKTTASTPPPPGDAGGDLDEMPPKAPGIDKTKMALREALELYSQGKVDQAESAFKRVLAADKQNADANFNLGAIEEGKGNLNDALRYYKQAQKTSPNDSDINGAVASIQTKLGSSDTAFLPPPAQSSGYSPKPQAPQTPLDPQKRSELKGRVQQAAAAFKRGDFDSSISILEDVSRQAPNESDVQYALAQSYKAKGRYLDARSALNNAIGLSPDNQMYQDARRDLDRIIASGGAHGNNSPRADDVIASDDNSNSGTAGGKAGQITPFTGIGAPGSSSPSGWQSTGYGGYQASNYKPEKSSRIQRAAVGGLTGAAMGAAFGGVFSGYGNRGRGVMYGAAIGGLFGLLRGF
jgi:tetratricopeptide (TPR) repeat protein